MWNFQYTKINIIIAVKWVSSLSQYTKNDIGWGFAPDPTGRAYSARLDPLYLVPRERFAAEGNGGEGREGLGGGGEGREGE